MEKLPPLDWPMSMLEEFSVFLLIMISEGPAHYGQSYSYAGSLEIRLSE